MDGQEAREARNRRCTKVSLGCALSSLSCGGLAMIIVGSVYLARASKDERSQLIAGFRTALDAWTGAGRAAWEAPSVDPDYFTATITTLAGFNATASLSLDGSSLERAYIEAAPDVPAFANPARYRRWNVPVSYVYPSDSATLSFTAQFRQAGASAWAAVQPMVWRSVYERTCKESSKYSCNRYGCNYGGLYANDQCYLWFVPDEVCIRVDRATGLVTGGCAVFSEDDRQAMGKPYRYDWVAHRRSASPPLGGQTAQVTLTVRAEDDPWVDAMLATGGAMGFGETAEELRGIGTGVLVAGIVLTALIAWLVHSCMTSCKHCCFPCCRASPVLTSGDPQKGVSYSAAGSVPVPPGGPMMAPMGFMAVPEASSGAYQQYVLQPVPVGQPVMQPVPAQQQPYMQAVPQATYAPYAYPVGATYAAAPAMGDPTVYYSNPQQPQQQQQG